MDVITTTNVLNTFVENQVAQSNEILEKIESTNINKTDVCSVRIKQNIATILKMM
jgi:hypothetical protein